MYKLLFYYQGSAQHLQEPVSDTFHRSNRLKTIYLTDLQKTFEITGGKNSRDK